MNVLQIIDVRWFNACAYYALTLSKALKDNGINVYLMGNPGTPVIEKSKNCGIETIENINFSSELNFFANIAALKKVIKSNNIHLINGHRGESEIPAVIAARNLNIPFIRTRGDIRLPRKIIFSKQFHRKYIDGVIVTSSKHFERYRAIDDKLVIKFIPIGVKIPQINSRDSDLKNKLSINDEDFVFLHVARFSPVKAHNIFISAAVDFLQNVTPQVKFIMIGYDEEYDKNYIQSLIPKQFLIKFVIENEMLNNLQSYYNIADCGLVTSIGSEAVSRTLIEYMASGMAVIASEVGQIPDVLDEEGGIIIRPNDSHCLLEAMRFMYLNPSFRARAGKHNRTEAIMKYSLETFVKSTMAFYEKVLKNKQTLYKKKSHS